MNNHDYLLHYGVKGMKWGVRRYQNQDGTLTDAGKKKYASKQKKTEHKIVRTERSIANQRTKQQKYQHKHDKAAARIGLTDFHEAKIKRMYRKTKKAMLKAERGERKLLKYASKLEELRELQQSAIQPMDIREFLDGLTEDQRIAVCCLFDDLWPEEGEEAIELDD